MKYTGGGGTTAINVSPAELVLNMDSCNSKLKSQGKYELPPERTPTITDKDDAYWKDIIPGKVVIGYDNTIDVYKASLRELNIADKGVNLIHKCLAPLNCVVVQVSDNLNDMKAFISTMKNKPHVKYVEPDRWMKLYGKSVTPNDPGFGPSQWDKKQLNCPAAWGLTQGYGDTVISIGIVDQGADYNHEDLVGRYGATKGYNFLSGTSDPMPQATTDDHGTHCSSNAASTINNGKGIAGVCDARLYSLRCGTGENLDMTACAEGIAWCSSHHVNIISMSLGWKWSGCYA